MDASTIRGKSDAVIVPRSITERYVEDIASIMVSQYRMDKNEADTIADFIKGAESLTRRNQRMLASALAYLYLNNGIVDYELFTAFYTENRDFIMAKNNATARKRTNIVDEEKYIYALYRYIKYASLYYAGSGLE